MVSKGGVGMTTLVLLDLDRTILTCNSAREWIVREWKQGHISTWQLVQTIGWLSVYHWGKSDVSTFLRNASQWMEGSKEVDLQERTHNFWMDSIRHQIRPSVYDVLEQHRSQGHVLALLTASSNYLSDLVAVELGIPHVLSNRMEVVDTRLTGRMIEPLCFGAGKALHAERLGQQLGINWREGYFYTDSYSDLPVLEVVAHPKVVCPDQRLEREAHKRGWDILMW